MNHYEASTLIGLVAGILAIMNKENKISMTLFTIVAVFWMVKSIIFAIQGV